MNLLVEGDLDEAVGRRLLAHSGAESGVTFGKRGYAYIRDKVAGFARASAGVPLLVLVDLMDTGFDCAGDLVGDWLPHRPPTVLLRAAVREIESWVIADRGGFAHFIGVRDAAVPQLPDEVLDPKREVIALARRSRHQSIQEAIVPRVGAATGLQYNSAMVDFVRHRWDPAQAANNSPSLRRCIVALMTTVPRLN